ncbi:MAG: GPW/gp25 family protein [Eubacteriales bacterium]
MENRTFLGSGMAFPIAVNPGTGRFEMSHGEVSVKQSVYLILMTGRGERWMRKSFGSKIMTYTFGDTSKTMLNLMSHDLRSAILQQEPRIKEVDVTVDPDQLKDALVVNIAYTLAETNTRDNFVFPFYLQTVKEEMPYESTDNADA